MFELSFGRKVLSAGALALTVLLASCGDSGSNGGSTSAGLGDRDFADIGREGDIMIGDPDAPVSIVEYASPTCPHCAQFHVQVFPFLKEEYIDTGLVRYTMRAMPTSPQAMSALAFMLGRCVDESRYYNFLDALFRTQQQWAFNPDPQARLDTLRAISQQAGMTDERFETCRRDEAELQRVQDQAEEAISLGVTATPSFFINGELQVGGLGWEQFEQLIIPHLPEELRPDDTEPESEADSGSDG